MVRLLCGVMYGKFGAVFWWSLGGSGYRREDDCP